MISILSSSRASARRGTSFIEVAVSSVLVGVLLIASLRGLAASTSAGIKNQHRAIAAHLAHDLLSEIANLPYEDPDETSVFGMEQSEIGAITRDSLDDVDDFHGWSESPPGDRFGNILTAGNGWHRHVVVEFVDPVDLATFVSTDHGVKRITVTVSRFRLPVMATAVGYQTASFLRLGSQEKISREPPVNQPPVAEIIADKTLTLGSTTVAFIGEKSFDPDGQSIDHHWDFGDGTTSAQKNPNHTFTNRSGYDKVFRVTLTVTDSSGAFGKDDRAIIVLAEERGID